MEYVFEETGSRVIVFDRKSVVFTLCADHNFSDEDRIREAIWIHVLLRMIYESSNRRKPLSLLIDLHKTHGRPISRALAQMYQQIFSTAHHITKICVVGDFFQCVSLKNIIMTIPDVGEKVQFFLNYQQGKEWLKWTH